MEQKSKICVKTRAETNCYPVRGGDVNQESGSFVPAEGDLFPQQQSVKLSRSYDLHL